MPSRWLDPRCLAVCACTAVACALSSLAVAQTTDPDSLLKPIPLTGRERLGQSVAVLPSLVVCGSPGFEAQGTDAGGALIFRLDRGQNRWIPDPWLTVPGAMPGQGFGAAIAAERSSLAIGSSGDRRVAVFDLDNAAAPPVLLSGGADFGRSLAIDEGTLVVGEPQRSGQVGRGRAIVFTQDPGGGWQQSQVLEIQSLSLNAGFGVAVAIRGNELLVGAPNALGTGAAYRFRRSDPLQSWALADTIRPDDLNPGDQFGASVAIGNRELVIGAPAADAAASNSGSAYVVPIVVGSGDLAAPARILAPNASANGLFGSAVAVRGDLLAVGAPLGDGFAGDAWVFRRRADESFEPAQRLAANAGEPFASFGTSLAIADEFIAAGAPQLDASPLQPDAGHVAVFETLPALGLQGDCNDNGIDDLVDLFVAGTATDCNGNARIDACEIAANPALDADGDGVLDGCTIDCPADLNADGLLTPADFNAWLFSYTRGCP